MFKKLVVLVVLFSMLLHCATRLGFVSYLYQKRHLIANSVGISVDIPIATCNNDYDSNSGLKIEMHDENQSVPLAPLQVREIVLFLDNEVFGALGFQAVFLNVLSQTPYSAEPYLVPIANFFQPPRS